jgi:hypothetical protein
LVIVLGHVHHQARLSQPFASHLPVDGVVLHQQDARHVLRQGVAVGVRHRVRRRVVVIL